MSPPPPRNSPEGEGNVHAGSAPRCREIRDTVSPRHPALAGHFPAHPVVPGVVLLTRVCRALVVHFGEAHVQAVTAVKFHAPLFPGEPFDVTVEPAHGNRVGFRVTRAGT